MKRKVLFNFEKQNWLFYGIIAKKKKKTLWNLYTVKNIDGLT